jgi:hypothetical protein
MSQHQDESDAGAPLPDFRASGIQLQTIAPALGVINQNNAPEYLDYDAGRGIATTMFANSGMSYLMGISMGGVYGIRQGLAATPSSRFRVQVNSILNHSGRYGSRAGNSLGTFAVMYTLFEGLSDRVRTTGSRMMTNVLCVYSATHTFSVSKFQLELEDKLGLRDFSPAVASFTSPAIGATLASAAYYVPSGPRVATLAGAIGFGAVAATYSAYSVLGIPYGSRGFLFF